MSSGPDTSDSRRREFAELFILRWGVAVVSCVLVGGCATDSNTTQTEPPPKVQAVEAARNEVRPAVADGFEASEQRDSYRVRARFNPPRCDAPTFEVHIHGRWTRAWFDAPTKTAESIQKYRDEADGSSARPFDIRGRVSGDREAETGISYPIFWVTQFDPNS